MQNASENDELREFLDMLDEVQKQAQAREAESAAMVAKLTEENGRLKALLARYEAAPPTPAPPQPPPATSEPQPVVSEHARDKRTRRILKRMEALSQALKSRHAMTDFEVKTTLCNGDGDAARYMLLAALEDGLVERGPAAGFAEPVYWLKGHPPVAPAPAPLPPPKADVAPVSTPSMNLASSLVKPQPPPISAESLEAMIIERLFKSGSMFANDLSRSLSRPFHEVNRVMNDLSQSNLVYRTNDHKFALTQSGRAAVARMA